MGWESNWRTNVALYNMMGSDWLLCADSVDAPGSILVVQRRVHPTWTYIYFVPAAGQLPVLANVFFPDPAFPSFPHGWEVLPD